MKKLKKEQIAIGNYHYVAYSFEYFLESVKNIGASNIEIWGAKPHLCVNSHSLEQVGEMRKRVEEKGLTTICFCPEQNTYPVDISTSDATLRKNSLEHMKKSISYTAQLGAKRMLLCPGNGYLDEPKEQIWERCRSSVKELAQTAADYGVILVLETQAQEDSLFLNTVIQQKRMLDEVNHPNLQAMLDTVQLAQFDESMEKSLQILGINQIKHVHLGNTLVREKTWGETRMNEKVCQGRNVVGHIGFHEGNLPIIENLRQLAEVDYSDYVTIEICQRAYYFEAERYAKEAWEIVCEIVD